jgi:hypothetical protein
MSLTNEPRRVYEGGDDLDALRNFITASGKSESDLALDVYVKMMALNQAIRNADVMGMRSRIIRGSHLWMSSDVLFLHITREGRDVDFIDQ